MRVYLLLLPLDLFLAGLKTQLKTKGLFSLDSSCIMCSAQRVSAWCHTSHKPVKELDDPTSALVDLGKDALRNAAPVEQARRSGMLWHD